MNSTPQELVCPRCGCFHCICDDDDDYCEVCGSLECVCPDWLEDEP